VVSRDRPVPLHEQLAQVLREKIASGELTTRVPSILTLAQEYEVSHKTAQHALETLKAEGLIVSVLGLGYFVAQV
jgi:DNA-binding GntR family transcriptional regulator